MSIILRANQVTQFLSFVTDTDKQEISTSSVLTQKPFAPAQQPTFGIRVPLYIRPRQTEFSFHCLVPPQNPNLKA